MVGFLGTLLAGAVAVPVNTRFAPPEIEYVIADSGAVATLRPGAPLPSGHPEALDDLVPVETAIRVVGIDRAEGPSLRNLVSVPLFHVTGCNSQLLVQLGLGGTTVVLPTFDADTFVRTIVEERIDTLVSVPAIYGLTPARGDLYADLSGVRRLTYGGAPMAPDLVRRLQERLPQARLGNGFGLTETASISTFLPHEWAVGELLIRGPATGAGALRSSRTAGPPRTHWSVRFPVACRLSGGPQLAARPP